MDNSLNADNYHLQRHAVRVCREILLLNGGGIEAALAGPLPDSTADSPGNAFLLCSDDRPKTFYGNYFL